MGHPFVHLGDACKDKEDCLRMESLIKFTIVPPEIVSSRFALPCQSETHVHTLPNICPKSNTEQCCHKTDDERAVTGTWVIDEVRLAVQKGHRFLEIHEVYEYKVTMYDPETRTGGLISGYINCFFKLKAEASGYPAWIRTQAAQERYIESFWKI